MKMKIISKMLNIALSCAMLASFSVTVFAADTSQTPISSTAITDENTIAPLSADDPTYLKVKYNSGVKAAYGSTSITHQSRYASYTKTYGIDVSYYQGNIDWTKVKSTGVEYAIIRLGYRGYGSAGTLCVDPKATTYIDEAKAAGLKVGAYFYTQAVNTTEAAAEATYCKNILNGRKLDLPVYYDIEYVGGRLDNANLSKAAKTALCTTFCNKMISYGYKSGVYTFYSWFKSDVNAEELSEKYPLWLAHVTDYTDFSSKLTMWQYSFTGSVSGIGTTVDMDVMYTEPEKIDYTPNGKPKLTYSSAGSGKVKLTWTSSTNCSGYTVYSKNLKTGKETAAKNLTSNSYTMTIPTAYTSCYVKPYKTVDSKKYYGTTSNDVRFEGTKTLALKVTDFTQKQVTLSWNAVPNAQGYLVYAKSSTDQDYTLKASIYGTCQNTVTGLKKSTVYSFIVKAYFNSNSSSVYDEKTSTLGKNSTIVTQMTKISAAYNISASSISSTYAYLKWDKLVGVCSGYEISIYNSTKNTYDHVAYTSSPKYTLSDLSKNKNYTYVVRGYYNYDGKKIPGYYSDRFTFKTSVASPTKLAVSSISGTNLTLKWNKVSGATSYMVYRFENSKLIYAGTSKTNSITLNGQKLGSSTVYKVRGIFNESGTIHTDSSSRLTVKFQYTAPKAPTMTDYSANSLSLNWDRPTGATGYEIYTWNGTTGNYDYRMSCTSSDAVLSKLKESTMYKIKIRAIYGKGNYSSFSPVLTVYTKPSTPTDFKCSSVTSTTCSLKWDKVKNATSYRVYRYNTSSKTYTILKEVSSTSTKLTGLKANTSYILKVGALITKNGRTYYSSRSDKITVNTK